MSERRIARPTKYIAYFLEMLVRASIELGNNEHVPKKLAVDIAFNIFRFRGPIHILADLAHQGYICVKDGTVQVVSQPEPQEVFENSPEPKHISRRVWEELLIPYRRTSV